MGRILGGVDLNDLLAVMDRAAANLDKLDAVWQRAESFIPSSPARGSVREYDDLGERGRTCWLVYHRSTASP